MAEPGRLASQSADNMDPEDVDADGEYEEDDAYYEQNAGEETHTQTDGARDTDAEGSDVDAEGEEVDEDDDSEPVGAVKIAAPDDAVYEEDDEPYGGARGDSSSDAKTSDSEHDSGSSESDADNHWEVQSEDGEEPEAEKAEPNVCVSVFYDRIICKILILAGTATATKTMTRAKNSRRCCRVKRVGTCVRTVNGTGSIRVVADMIFVPAAHRQCARDANTLSLDDGTYKPTLDKQGMKLLC